MSFYKKCLPTRKCWWIKCFQKIGKIFLNFFELFDSDSELPIRVFARCVSYITIARRTKSTRDVTYWKQSLRLLSWNRMTFAKKIWWYFLIVKFSLNALPFRNLVQNYGSGNATTQGILTCGFSMDSIKSSPT